MATESVKVVDPDDGTGADYTSLSAWEAGEQKDLVTADEIAVAKCRCTNGSADTDAVVIGGWTTDSTHYIKIWTDPNENYRHGGVWSSSKYRLETSNVDCITNYERHVRIDGLQIKLTTNSEQYAIWSKPNGPSDVRISNNIIKGVVSGGSWVTGINTWQSDSSAIHKCWNNIIYGFNGSGGAGIGNYSSGTLYAYNNTISDCEKGILSYNGYNAVTHAINNAVFNNDDDFNGTFSTCDYNASDDVDGTNAVDISPSTNEEDDWDNAFIDYVNGDFHIKDTNSVLYNTGTNDPGSGLFNDDIDGDTRSDTWDIGADEYVSAAYATSYTIDSLLQALGLTEQVTTDALLQKRDLEEAFNIDALLQKALLSSLTVNGLLRALGLTTLSTIDVLLERLGVTQSVTSSVLLQKTQTNVVTVSALLQLLGLTTQTSIDVVLQKLSSTQITLDMLLKAVNLPTSTTIDSLLEKLNLDVTAVVDVVISGALQESMTINTLIKKLGVTTSTTIDTLLQKTNSIAFQTNTLLSKQLISSITIDIFLKALNLSTESSVDVLLQKLNLPQSLLVDVLLTTTQGMQLSTDALLTGEQVVQVVVDVLLQSLGLKRSVSINALLQRLGLGADYSCSTLLQKLRVTTSFVVDVLLCLVYNTTLSVDTLLLKRFTSPAWRIDTILVPLLFCKRKLEQNSTMTKGLELNSRVTKELELGSRVTEELELNSGVTKELELSSRVTKELELNSEVTQTR